MTTTTRKGNGKRLVYRHSALIRICHWINAVAFVCLLLSGLQIFNAHPALNFGVRTDFDAPFFELSALANGDDVVKGETRLFGWTFDTTGVLGASRDETGALADRGFPSYLTLPAVQDLATGRRWHFFFAWVLAINGFIYFANILARRRIGEFMPSSRDWRALPHTIVDHIKLKFSHGADALHYNVLQKLAYLSVLIAFPVLILAGLTMSPAMDAIFPWLLDLFGGRQSARTIHFLLASYLVIFLIVHLIMVVLSGPINNLRGMITGRFAIRED